MTHIPRLILVFVLATSARAVADDDQESILFDASYGRRLPGSTRDVGLWRASSGWKVCRTRPVPKRRAKAIEIRAARNEAEAAQLVVRPRNALRGFSATAGTLSGPGDACVRVEVLRVRYVDVARPTDRAASAAPWPDPLPPFKGPIDLAAGENQPLWVRVHVPRDAVPGDYGGAIQLTAEGYRAEVPLRVVVYGFELPDRMTCTTAFGFNPGTVYQYQKISDAAQRRAVIAKYFESFRAHHISPYNPAPFDSIKVDWVTLADGEGADLPEADLKLLRENPLTPVFDWTAWDAAVEHAFATYHFNSMRIGVPGIRGGTFGKSGADSPGFGYGTRGHELAFTAYCQALQGHFREKGWLDEAFIYWFDEPTTRDYERVREGFLNLKQAAPGLNRMITEQVEPGLVGGPNIWCPLTMYYRHEETVERRRLGERFWWYVCTIPKKPYCGLFTDHAGTDLRAWLWLTWKYGIEGILVWHSNLWTTGMAYPDKPQNPYEDAMSWVSGYGTKRGEKRPWGNGDGRFIYPPEAAATAQQDETILDGPVDSIRWEMLRDGIEDYEYMAILRRLLEDAKATLPPRVYKRYAALLDVPASIASDMKTYTKDPVPIEKHRNRIACAIEELAQR